jgi:hypothetical protein
MLEHIRWLRLKHNIRNRFSREWHTVLEHTAMAHSTRAHSHGTQYSSTQPWHTVLEHTAMAHSTRAHSHGTPYSRYPRHPSNRPTRCPPRQHVSSNGLVWQHVNQSATSELAHEGQSNEALTEVPTTSPTEAPTEAPTQARFDSVPSRSYKMGAAAPASWTHSVRYCERSYRA